MTTTIKDEIRGEIKRLNEKNTELQKETNCAKTIQQNTTALNTTEILFNNCKEYFLFDSRATKVDLSKLTNVTDTNAQITAINTNLQSLQILQDTIPELKQRYTENIEKLKTIQSLLNFQEQLGKIDPSGLKKRTDEFASISDIAKDNLLI